jgi:hypothetical protein
MDRAGVPHNMRTHEYNYFAAFLGRGDEAAGGK